MRRSINRSCACVHILSLLPLWTYKNWWSFEEQIYWNDTWNLMLGFSVCKSEANTNSNFHAFCVLLLDIFLSIGCTECGLSLMFDSKLLFFFLLQKRMIHLRQIVTLHLQDSYSLFFVCINLFISLFILNTLC